MYVHEWVWQLDLKFYDETGWTDGKEELRMFLEIALWGITNTDHSCNNFVYSKDNKVIGNCWWVTASILWQIILGISNLIFHESPQNFMVLICQYHQNVQAHILWC